MGKKILDSKILYVVLSILISLSLWLWVTSQDKNKESQGFKLPVTLEGVDILEDRGLMIVNESVTATVNIRATPMVLAKLRNTPPELKANVSNISTEGIHTVNYTVSPPSGVSQNDVEIISGLSGSAVKVEVARSLSREVEIRGEFQGTVAEGYLAGDKDDFLFNPGKLTVSGRAELVNQVAYAKVIVDGENLTKTVEGQYPFQLIGASGDPLDLDVTCDVDTIYTSYRIRATAEVPLEVKLIDGGGLKNGDVRVSLDTDTIMVAGTREAVDGLLSLGSITLTTLDLAALDDEIVEKGGEMTVPIPLDDQLENLSGVTDVKVTVKVTKRGVETREFSVTRISTVNAPKGWTSDIITQELKVKVRGTKALLDALELTEESIWAVADLGNVNEAAGSHTVSASIYLNSAGSVGDVGVVNPRDYTVVVSLSQGG